MKLRRKQQLMTARQNLRLKLPTDMSADSTIPEAMAVVDSGDANPGFQGDEIGELERVNDVNKRSEDVATAGLMARMPSAMTHSCQEIRSSSKQTPTVLETPSVCKATSYFSMQVLNEASGFSNPAYVVLRETAILNDEDRISRDDDVRETAILCNEPETETEKTELIDGVLMDEGSLTGKTKPKFLEAIEHSACPERIVRSMSAEEFSNPNPVSVDKTDYFSAAEESPKRNDVEINKKDNSKTKTKEKKKSTKKKQNKSSSKDKDEPAKTVDRSISTRDQRILISGSKAGSELFAESFNSNSLRKQPRKRMKSDETKDRRLLRINTLPTSACIRARQKHGKHRDAKLDARQETAEKLYLSPNNIETGSKYGEYLSPHPKSILSRSRKTSSHESEFSARIPRIKSTEFSMSGDGSAEFSNSTVMLGGSSVRLDAVESDTDDRNLAVYGDLAHSRSRPASALCRQDSFDVDSTIDVSEGPGKLFLDDGSVEVDENGLQYIFMDEDPFDYDNDGSDEGHDRKVTVPISICLVIIAGYILGGSMLFSIWEQWDIVAGSYFCFITLSTIGFGDIVPGTDMKDWASHEKLVLCALWLAFGLSLLAMCFNLMQEGVKERCKWIGQKLGLLKDEDGST